MTQGSTPTAARASASNEALGDGSATGSETALAPANSSSASRCRRRLPGERAAYKRATGRARAEWPLVELAASASIEAGEVTRLRLVAGGVAPVPLRLARGGGGGARPAGDARRLSPPRRRAAVEGANPLPQAAYKLELLQGLVRDLLETVSRPG